MPSVSNELAIAASAVARPAVAEPEFAEPGFADVLAAAARIAPYARVTPVLRAASLDALAGCALHFKCENLQRGGAFKFRGACNAVFALDDETAARGVVTQSSGNHGAAVALACRLRGLSATVVVPHAAPKVKLEAIRDFGARIVHCEVSQASRNATTAQVLAETGGALVHPFNDPRVIAGQGTATLELMQQAPDLDCVIAPVSGGGLLSGTALAALGVAAAQGRGIAVFGAEPSGAADAHASLQRGERVLGQPTNTICDGLRAELGSLTFPILRRDLREILLVDDADTVAAMRLLWERLKVVVEPSGAIGLAAVLRNRERFAGARVGIVLSGGNVDLGSLPWQA